MGEDDGSKSGKELARERTDWAEDRTLLANERTFAGWMRTGLASAGVGLGLNAIFRSFEPTWLAKAGATVFLVIALVIFFLAHRAACTVHERLNAHAAEPVHHSNFGAVAGGMALGTIMIGAILWLL